MSSFHQFEVSGFHQRKFDRLSPVKFSFGLTLSFRRFVFQKARSALFLKPVAFASDVDCGGVM